MRYFALDGTPLGAPAIRHSAVEDDPPYTTTPSHVRVYDEGDNEHPWMLDAFDCVTGFYSEDVRTFATEDEAVAFIPAFVASNAFPPVRPLVRSISYVPVEV